MVNGVRAVFLDRDGILNELRPDPLTGLMEGPLSVTQVALKSDAVAGVQRLHDAGYLVVGVTNQPAAAKGRISLQQQEDIHQRVLALLDDEGASLDAWRVCPHHPEGTDPTLTKICNCRKPEPGMILDAAAAYGIDLGASWMIGDSDSDIEAGIAAGMKTAIVGETNGHKRQVVGRADVHSQTFAEAVEAVFIES